LSITDSSLNRSVLVDIVNGKNRRVTTNFHHEQIKIFQLFEVLQALSDRADDMTINIEVRAHTKQNFDLSWIRNGENHDEMDIQAFTPAG